MLNSSEQQDNLSGYNQEEENSYLAMATTLQFRNLKPRYKESLRDLKWQELKYTWKIKKIMMKQGFKSGAIGGGVLGLVLGIPLAFRYR